MNRFVLLLTFMMVLCADLRAQNYSTDVTLVEESGNTVTLEATAVAEKKKDASLLAAKSAFHTLFHAGVDGLKNGVPMVSVERKDYDYRFFNESRYISYISGEINNIDDEKIGGKYRVKVRVSIQLKSLVADLEKNKMALNPGWSDSKAVKATAALNPTIVVVPYVRGENTDFAAMRNEVNARPALKTIIGKLTGEFGKNGYKTRDFITMLQNSKTNTVLTLGSQSDEKTKIVQQIPGDIVVTVDVIVNTNGNGKSDCQLNISAVEGQTSGNLASASFVSGQYSTTDTVRLADHALGKISKDFFTGLQSSFEDFVKKGREIVIELTLSETVSDWDFDQDTPNGSNNFKDVFDEWLRKHSHQGVYDMGLNTDKYVHATVNIPLWDMEKNRSYSISNFGSDVRKFFKEQFGDSYKASVTALGQKLLVTIE